MIGSKGVNSESGGGAGLYVYPGVMACVAMGLESGKANSGTPFVGIKLCTVKGFEDTKEGEEKPVRTLKVYLTENNQEKSIAKLTHFLTKFVKRAEVDAVEADSFEAYCNKIAALFDDKVKGKKIRMKVIGREYEDESSGEIKVAPELGLPPFAEALVEGAEHEPILDEDKSKLTFDKTNKYDYKSLGKSASSDFEASAEEAKLDEIDADDL